VGGGRLVAGLAVAACALGIAACGDDEPSMWTSGPSQPVQTRDPARMFAPVVNLHARERSFPIAAADFLASATFKWAGRDCFSYETIATGTVATKKTADDVPLLDQRRLGLRARRPYRHREFPPGCGRRGARLYSVLQLTRPYGGPQRPPGLPAQQGFYLDLLSEALPGRRRVRAQGPQTVLHGVPAYVERRAVRIDGGPGLRLDYWMLYGHNGPIGRGGSFLSHEGDWEHVSVLVRRLGPGRYEPSSLRLYVWDEPRDVPWRDVLRLAPPTTGPATHPAVFAARGSHTPYATPGMHSARVPADGVVRTVAEPAEACDECPQWRTWTRLLRARAQPWYGFGGGWGLSLSLSDSSADVGALGPYPAR
jgi:hypothetical protein